MFGPHRSGYTRSTEQLNCLGLGPQLEISWRAAHPHSHDLINFTSSRGTASQVQICAQTMSWKLMYQDQSLACGIQRQERGFRPTLQCHTGQQSWRSLILQPSSIKLTATRKQDAKIMPGYAMLSRLTANHPVDHQPFRTFSAVRHDYAKPHGVTMA